MLRFQNSECEQLRNQIHLRLDEESNPQKALIR